MATAAAPAPSAVRNLRRFIRPLPSNVYGDWQKRPPPHGATMRPGPFERKPPKLKLVTHQTIGDYRAALLTSACQPLRDPSSSLDHDLRRDAPCRYATLDLLKHLGGDLAIDFGVHAVRLGGDHRHAGIRFLADGHVQRHFAEERHALALGFLTRTAMAKYIRTRAATRAQEIAHVFNDAEHRHVHALEHGDAAPCVNQRQILRGRDDDRALERHLLRHGELRVASAGRHVDHHDVEL